MRKDFKCFRKKRPAALAKSPRGYYNIFKSIVTEQHIKSMQEDH